VGDGKYKIEANLAKDVRGSGAIEKENRSKIEVKM
jgi:hypothetical protein